MKKRKLLLLTLSLLVLLFSSYWQVFQPEGLKRLLDRSLHPGLSASEVKSSLETGIHTFQNRIRQNPKDAVSLTLLGQLYLGQARLTGEVGAYQRAESALRRALGLLPGYAPASAALAAVLYAQHDFRAALDLATQLYQADARRVDALATMSDAHLALGQYDQAAQVLSELQDREHVPQVLARQAYLAELRGRPDEALNILKQAVGMAYKNGESQTELAWYRVRLGDLYFNQGRIPQAGKQYQAATRLAQNYYPALAGLGKVRAAQGRYEDAIRFYVQAVEILPQPDLLAALGDLYRLTGQTDQAEVQYATVEITGKLAETNRQIYNRQLAYFYADHDLNLEKALDLATAELEYRKDVYGYDAAAWAYYKNGMFSQAQKMMDKALQLGTRDARLYYHAGLIALALGEQSGARQLLKTALDINPHFDPLQSMIAQETLSRLSIP